MSRFFKSAAFPILIVVVLAFFAQRLISPSGETKKPDFGQFLTQINQGQVKSADIKTKDNTVDVTLNDGRKYTVGYLTAIRRLLSTRSTRRPASSTSRVSRATVGCRC
jgi:cell division protease FtsH